MDIILDSNVWLSDVWLESQRMRILLDYTHKVQGRVILLEAVELEVHAHVERRLEEAVQDVRKALAKADRLRVPDLPPFDGTAARTGALDAWLSHMEEVTDRRPIRRVALDVSAAREAVRRAARRLPPCHNKPEYRDALIWLSALEFAAAEERDHPLVFITANTRDFGTPGEEGELHPDLQTEVTDRGIDLRFYSNLDAFVSEHAERFDYLTIEWVQERLPDDLIAELVKDILPQRGGIRYRVTPNWDDHDHKVRSLRRIHRVDVALEDVFIWKFDEDHTEISVSGWAYVEADAECERIRQRQWPPRSYEEPDLLEWELADTILATVWTEVGFDLAATVAGDEITDPAIDDLYNL